MINYNLFWVMIVQMLSTFQQKKGGGEKSVTTSFWLRSWVASLLAIYAQYTVDLHRPPLNSFSNRDRVWLT